jgi:hypothetical protein
VTLNEDTPTTITLQAADVDSTPLTYVIVAGPSHGSLGSVAGNTVEYTPSANYNGPDQFTFKANDGTTDSNVATVSLTVNAVNDPPVPVDDSAATDSNLPLVLNASTLTANDTDPENDPLTVTAVSGAVHGTVALAAGKVTFTPQAGYGGPASFQYTVADGRGGEATGTVNVAVTFQPPFPIRAAFYYGWFSGSDPTANSWFQSGRTPVLGTAFTNYTPSLGFYNSADPDVTRAHVGAMQYGKISTAIYSWWGQGHRTDTRLPGILQTSNALGTDFRWAIYYELEGTTNPTVAQIQSDLTYLKDHYANDPGMLRIDGKFVVFVYNADDTTCDVVDRWTQANDGLGKPAYVDLKVFTGYKLCAAQPDAWHQYAPEKHEDRQAGNSFAISPGFYKDTESLPRVGAYRDPGPDGFQKNVRDMVASGEKWQLVETFNEWGEGTGVESTLQTQSDSGYGTYLDILHNDGTPTTGDPVLLAAGDIASSRAEDEATADILQLYPSAVVAPLGDLVYEAGSDTEFASWYTPSWGRPDIRARSRPAIGNHEYKTTLPSLAAGFFNYWSLNSNCTESGLTVSSFCAAGSPQELWLKQDLAANTKPCILAYWHHPRFSSGIEHGSDANGLPSRQRTLAFWNDLYAAGADLVLNGHEHNYEVFAPQNPLGVADPSGIREIVTGTGGKDGSNYTLGPPIANSAVGNDKTMGVLRLTLHDGSYDWAFLPIGGRLPVSPAASVFTDSGQGTCH